MHFLDFALAAVALIGHVALWFAAFNRLHAGRISHNLLHGGEKILAVAILGVLVWFAADGWRQGACPASYQHAVFCYERHPLAAGYLLACWFGAVWMAPTWLAQRLRSTPAVLARRDVIRGGVRKRRRQSPARSAKARWLSRLPGNQAFDPQLECKTLVLERLPPAWNSLRIVHLSDLHLEGAVGLEHFEAIVEQVQALEADLIAVTGDIVDHRRAFPWLERIAPRLAAPLGVFYVLGNHDLRPRDEDGIRDRLRAAGWRDLGGEVIRTHPLPGQASSSAPPLVLAGNELPWFGPPVWDTASSADVEGFRILLSHSPDQIDWARRREFDLMLCGHTHGGQIQLPGLGPMFVPSSYGLKYASGVFHEPPTVMHVSRGVGGLEPLRWNCPPEISLLTLQSNYSNRRAPQESRSEASEAAPSQACC